jgi:hypothetical protein
MFRFINLSHNGWLDISQYCKLIETQLLLLEMQKDVVATQKAQKCSLYIQII